MSFEKMDTAEKMCCLVDLLQTTIDDAIEDYEALQDAYMKLLEENEELKDCIATLMNQKGQFPADN